MNKRSFVELNMVENYLINTKKALKQCWLCVSTYPRLWEYICDQDREESCHHGAPVIVGETDNKQVSWEYNTF